MNIIDIIDIINKKRTKVSLSYEEINFFISGYVDGIIPDYQISSLLMAIAINGMNDEEIFNLTDIMLKSGEQIDLSSINKTVVDKHSTGGIGDKTTLILAPLVASCDVAIAKMSGRGLGYTGGTIDKLESIGNFKTSMSIEQFINQVNDIGIAIVGQMGNLVPADKKLYALRDVNGTVASIPLIASSIMSKKIASGASKIVIDVKLGNGALINSIEEARELASLMIKIGKKYEREVVCFITNMDEPLGFAIGNSLEVIESINTLKGNGPKDLEELVTKLGSYMVSIAKGISVEQASVEVKNNLKNGKAYNKFLEFVEQQDGNINDIKLAEKVFSVKSKKTGFITKINALKLGELSCQIGAGRKTKDDVIDHGVGFVLNKKIGDYVLENEEIIKVYLSNIDLPIGEILDCFTIKQQSEKIDSIIYDIIK